MDNHLAKYKAFVKTVEKGSFTKAAEALNYAQSSVSKMIADLESVWGVTLLERNRNGVFLTTAGEQILPLIRRVLNGNSELEGYVNQMNGIQSGTVRIGTFASVAVNWLPNIFARLQRDYPEIEYEMLIGDYGEIERWIAEGRVDCGFLSLPTSADFDTAVLKRDEYMVIMPVGHPLARNKTVKIEALDGEPFLLLEHGGKTEVSALLEKSRVHPKIRFTTWEDFAIMAMAEQNLGIGILPSMILKRIPYEIEIRPLETPYYREIGIAVKDKGRLTPAAQKFAEYLKFRETPVNNSL